MPELSMEDIMGAAMGGGSMGQIAQQEKVFTATEKEAMLMDMQELSKAYIKGCPFEVGDVVTPRANCNMRGEGLPHIVVAVNKDAEPHFHGDVGYSNNGAVLDIRVMNKANGDQFICHWVESYQFIPYED